MSSKNYIADCVDKSGTGRKLVLTEQQTATIQGLLAGSIQTGRVLSMLKKDIFEYGKMRVMEDVAEVTHPVAPLNMNAQEYVALRAILGMSGETADICETVYSYIQNDDTLAIGKLKEDLGDLTFYMSLILDLIGSDWEEIFELNRRKTDLL